MTLIERNCVGKTNVILNNISSYPDEQHSCFDIHIWAEEKKIKHGIVITVKIRIFSFLLIYATAIGTHKIQR